MRALLLLLTMATPAAAFEVEPWAPLPDGLAAAQPNLSPHPAGGVLVSWVDFPSLVATPDGHLWAHLLRKNDSATYAYDAVYTHSSDADAHWSALTPLHDDDSASEHGFASLLAIGEDRLLAAWLDGRNTLPVAGGTRGAMSLRLAVSTDAGEHFAAAREIAGADSLGCADPAFAGDALWLSWLRESKGEQSLWLARFDRAGRELARQQLVTLSGRGRATGVPRLWADAHSALLLWTEEADGQSRVRGAIVRP